MYNCVAMLQVVHIIFEGIYFNTIITCLRLNQCYIQNKFIVVYHYQDVKDTEWFHIQHANNET